jgi:hypothetical protein
MPILHDYPGMIQIELAMKGIDERCSYVSYSAHRNEMRCSHSHPSAELVDLILLNITSSLIVLRCRGAVPVLIKYFSVQAFVELVLQTY